MEFKKLFEITGDSKVALADELKNLLHTELCMGMTRFVCRHGTLGDGFEKLTDSQKYYQAVKETYVRACELRRAKANAKKAYADYLEAKAEVANADNEIKKLRAESKLELAELSAMEQLVHAEDTLRQLDEFNKVRLELQESVRAQYPAGIEQAEPDNWKAVMQYRLNNVPATLSSIPLPLEQKQKIGLEFQQEVQRLLGDK